MELIFLASVELDQALHVQAYCILSIFSSKACLLEGGEGKFLDAVERWSLCSKRFLMLTDTGYLMLLLQEVFFLLLSCIIP